MDGSQHALLSSPRSSYGLSGFLLRRTASKTPASADLPACARSRELHDCGLCTWRTSSLKHSLPVKMQAGVCEFPALSSSLWAQHVQWGYERLLTPPQAVHQAPAMRSKNRNDLISILLQRMQTWCKETALHPAFWERFQQVWEQIEAW